LTDESLGRDDILKFLREILEKQSQVIEILSDRICQSCRPEESDWGELREKATKHMKGLVTSYSFARRLPKNELGISTQAAASNLLRIQGTLGHVFVLVDMVRDDTFGEIYMDSLRTIASKLHDQILALMGMTQYAKNTPEMKEGLEAVLRLERAIDEDNIVICRQISVATGGEGDWICYMLRKIVRELEHISDYLKECAEIIADI